MTASPRSRVCTADTATGGALLTVADRGPGVAAPAPGGREDDSRPGSTGLGLDIARRTAEASGGRLEIENARRGGAVVRLTLGPPVS